MPDHDPKVDELEKSIIERMIYDKSVHEPGFAIAYAMIQVAGALNEIASELTTLNVSVTIVDDK